jgi:N-ethylmaleimide reductase
MDLFSPIRVGALELPHRIVMAPMARARSGLDRAPTPMVADYYAQRAGAAFLITEASTVSPVSVSRPHASGAYLNIHRDGWKLVTEKVHAKGGRIFQQLYHLGRKADPSRMPEGIPPVAPSPIAAKGQVAGANGPVDFAVPRPLALAEIPDVVAEFRAAAQKSLAAGMDGAEIHGANAYLIDQFLRNGANHRDDAYGGSIANRARFLLEVVDAVVSVFGAPRVGVRLSPHSRGDGIGDSDPTALYAYVASALAERHIAYLHLVEAVVDGLPQSPAAGSVPVKAAVRRAFAGPLIVNGGYTRESADAIIASGEADMVAFGALFIANPDLVERFRRHAPFNKPDPSSFHNGGPQGYIDYPTLDKAMAADD